MTSLLILAALWLVVLWRVPGLRQNPWKRAPWIALAALAVALTVDLPAAIRAIDRVTGVADLATLTRHVAGIIACTAVLDWVSALKNPSPRPGLRRRHVVAAAAVAALAALFPFMPRPETGDFAATVTSGTAAAYLLVFSLYLGTAMAVASVLFWHVSRRPPDGSPRGFRWGLRLLAAGTTLGTGYAAYQTAYVGLRVTGIISPADAVRLFSPGTGLENLAILLILAGMTVPALSVAWDGVRDLASLHALSEMRAILVNAVPGISAGPLPAGPAGPLGHPHLYLARRVSEIRDAALALRSRVAPEAINAARTRLAARGLEGPALDAAAEACWLRLAIRAAWAGAPPVTSAHVLAGGDSLREEARWLRAVSVAAWTDDVTAVTREVAGEAASGSGRWPSVTTTARPAGKSFARHVTDILEPKNWIIATAILIGWHSERLAGIGWGLLGALFAAVLPTIFIQYGMRRGKWTDRHVGARAHRLIVMTFIIASVAIGLGLLAGLHAPQPVIAMTVTMLAAIIVMMAITVKWKISVHCAVSSGATVMLALTCGAPLLAAYALVGLVAWSRAELRDHTPAQAAAGTVLGALSGLIFLALR